MQGGFSEVAFQFWYSQVHGEVLNPGHLWCFRPEWAQLQCDNVVRIGLDVATDSGGTGSVRIEMLAGLL